MDVSRRFGFAFLALLALAGGTAFAATAKVEGTPVPILGKPDFATMKFLIGTWQCTELSSRRPGPFTITEVYSMDPSGYWILRETTTHKASWIPRDFHAESKYTYDASANRWVRITTGDNGTYQVATAPNPSGPKKTYSFVIETKAVDIASYAPEVYVKESDTKKVMTSSFTEISGRVVTVHESCIKS